MGSPTSCEYSDPRGSGDTLQDTDSGQAVYRTSTGTASFVSGDEHWALVGSSVGVLGGDSVDPPVYGRRTGGCDAHVAQPVHLFGPAPRLRCSLR